jgi:hypothetical protein
MPQYAFTTSDDFDELLARIARRKSCTKAEVIRRAVASYAFLHNEVKLSKGRRKVSITNSKDKVLADVVLP